MFSSNSNHDDSSVPFFVLHGYKGIFLSYFNPNEDHCKYDQGNLDKAMNNRIRKQEERNLKNAMNYNNLPTSLKNTPQCVK